MSDRPPHALRPGDQGDRGYIFDTWLQTYRASPFANKLPDFAYWSRFGHVGLVERVLDAAPLTDSCMIIREHGSARIAGERVTVVCLPESPAFMYGYAVTEGEALHYLFVRNDFRGQGFGRLLLAAVGMHSGPLTVTHMTTDFSRGLGRGREIRFVNPYRKAT